MSHFIRSCALALGTFILACSAVNAQTYYPNDATINNFLFGSAIIGYANSADYNSGVNGSSPMVSLVKGGFIRENLLAYNHSVFNLTANTIGGGGYAFNSSVINMSGGFIFGQNTHNFGNYLTAYDNSTINFSGGLLGGNNVPHGGIYTFNNSAVNVTGGRLEDVNTYDDSVANLSGGSVGYLQVNGRSVLNISGVNLSAALFASNVGNSGYDEYFITGALNDGVVLDTELIFQNGGGARVTFNGKTVINSTPEPGSVALFVGMMTVGAGILRRRRK